MSPTPITPGEPPSLTRLLDLVWGGDTSAIDGWHEAFEAWSQAWVRSVLPAWPWVVPAEALAPAAAPAAPAEVAAPFRTHPPGTPIEELSVGDSASVTKRVSQADIEAFARISGDDNPAHVDAAWAEASRFGGRVAHGVLTAGLISAVLGTQLPGPGSIYMSQTLKWLAPVRPDDLLTATATITEIIPEKGRVVLETVVTRDGVPVLAGEALVMPPGATPKARGELPSVTPPAPTPPATPVAKLAAKPPTKARAKPAKQPSPKPAKPPAAKRTSPKRAPAKRTKPEDA
jgi:3-hydroxybutyryl-CoA dehydratase